MQTFGLVIFTGVGVALIAGLSVALHVTLPASMWERAGRHGRFLGRGTPDRRHDTTVGNAPLTGRDFPQGQSV
jgi:hypothetical protein